MNGVWKHEIGINLLPNSSSVVTALGDLASNSTSNKLEFHNGTSASNIVTEIHASQGSARLKNKDLEDSTTAIVDSSDTTIKILFNAGGSTGTTTTLTSAQTASRVLTLPDLTDTLVSRISSDLSANRLQNKHLDASNILLVDTSDTTKRIKFDPSGSTTSTTLTIAAGNSVDRTYTIPDVSSNASFVMTAGAQTVGGAKTFSSAVTINPTTNQLVLGVTNTTTINSVAPSASRVYTLPDAGTNASFLMSEGAQTINGINGFTNYIIHTAISTPGGTPSAGTVFAYFKSDNKFYRKDSGGTEKEIGGGALIASGSRGSPNSITAAGGITSGSNQRSTIYVTGNGGAVTITANPQITAGSLDEQELIIVGCSNTNTVTLSNGTGLILNGDCELGADQSLYLRYDGTSWVEVTRSE